MWNDYLFIYFILFLIGWTWLIENWVKVFFRKGQYRDTPSLSFSHSCLPTLPPSLSLFSIFSLFLCPSFSLFPPLSLPDGELLYITTPFRCLVIAALDWRTVAVPVLSIVLAVWLTSLACPELYPSEPWYKLTKKNRVLFSFLFYFTAGARVRVASGSSGFVFYRFIYRYQHKRKKNNK